MTHELSAWVSGWVGWSRHAYKMARTIENDMVRSSVLMWAIIGTSLKFLALLAPVAVMFEAWRSEADLPVWLYLLVALVYAGGLMVLYCLIGLALAIGLVLPNWKKFPRRVFWVE